MSKRFRQSGADASSMKSVLPWALSIMHETEACPPPCARTSRRYSSGSIQCASCTALLPVNAPGCALNPELIMDQTSSKEDQLRDAALEYHRSPTRGKISVTPTKALSNQRDLSLAYSPGVAYACMAIAEDAAMAAEYTSRGNLVAVITN